jgi:Skp family chaperone for outer membrane proteins
MLRKFGIVALCLSVALFAWNSLTAADEKVPSIEDIMKKVPHPKKGLAAKTVEAVKADKWEDAQKMATELKTFGEALGKNKVPKGDAKSWEKLCKEFADQMSDIEKGAKAKDAAAVTKAEGAFRKSCKACHDAHKD